MGRIPSLDGLRAISIAMVVLSHTGIRGGSYFARVDAAANAIVNADLGVNIFFVISGYLITRLLMREMGGTARIDLGAFYWRRTLRIFPAFYCYLLAIRVLAWSGAIDVPWGTWIASVIFLRNYLAPLHLPPEDWYTSHIWSLSVEEQFYLFWPGCLALTGLRRGRWVALCLILASPFIRLATFRLWPYMRFGTNNAFHTRIDTLMMGCLVAMLADSPAFRLATRRAYAAGLPLAAVIFLWFGSPWLRREYGIRYTMPLAYGLEAACIALVMLWAIDNPVGIIGRLLNCRPVVRVGVISYGLYLWQQPCTKMLPLPWSVVTSLILAEVSYRFVERPFIGLRGHYAPRPRPAKV